MEARVGTASEGKSALDTTHADQTPPEGTSKTQREEPTTPVLDEETKKQADEAREQVFGGKQGFDPSAKADMTKAQLYGEARKVKNLTEYSSRQDHNPEMVCECCGLPSDADDFPFCTPIQDLEELGPGIPLFYYFMQYIAFILFVGFMVVGIACWASNQGAGNADEWGEDSDKNFIINMSLGSHGKDDIPPWQVFLHITFMIIMIISYYRLRSWQYKKEVEIDKNETTASDYTLWVRGLGKKFDPDEVKQFFHENGLPAGAPVEVVRVNVPYEISDYVDYVREHTELKDKLTFIEEY